MVRHAVARLLRAIADRLDPPIVTYQTNVPSASDGRRLWIASGVYVRNDDSDRDA